jgi:signal transduction histidine kinase
MMGYTREDCESGQINWAGRVAPEYEDDVKEWAARLMLDGNVSGYEREFLRPDGRRTRYIGAAAIVNPNEDIHVSIALDVTKIREAEEVLKRDAEKLNSLIEEQANRLLSQQRELEMSKRLSDMGKLAATVAHELRNPLSAIVMAVHNIKRKSDESAVHEHILSIEGKLRESETIIDNLLAYTKIRPPQRESVNIAELLDECRRERFAKNDAGIRFEEELGPVRGLTIPADPYQLREVFSNLLNNARDAVKKGEGVVNISAHREKDSLIISIRDNGSGMDTITREKMYQPFFTTKPKGTGLGLSVCEQIVHLHDGAIQVESTPGRGTEVVVTLPVSRPA